MRQLNEISQERDAMRTIVELTGAFEGIASMRIGQIKTQVQNSEQFFGELWKIYRQIRVDELFHFGRSQSLAPLKKELMILVTSEGSLSGDIDQQLIARAAAHYQPDKNDILVIGHHGTLLLSQAHINFVKSFKLPVQDRNINVSPLVNEVQKYASTVVYYQSYISLAHLEIKNIQLSAAVVERGRRVADSPETISERNYLFEPSTYEVVDHLERSMMQITLSEVILESKLAQYASRFRAMTTARDKADEAYADLNTSFNRARRHQKDERLKEIINSMKGREL